MLVTYHSHGRANPNLQSHLVVCRHVMDSQEASPLVFSNLACGDELAVGSTNTGTLFADPRADILYSARSKRMGVPLVLEVVLPARAACEECQTCISVYTLPIP
jgi:hypothetical protein